MQENQEQTAHLNCPHCNSKSVTKQGIRKIKHENIQIYKCLSCKKYFSNKKFKYKSYTAKAILNTITLYNLGNTLEKTAKEMARRHHERIPVATIHSWLKTYKETCTYRRLREKAKQLYSPDFLIFSKKFHHEQVYSFKVHKAKSELLFEDTKFIKHRKFSPVKEYLEKVPTDKFPHHIFGPKNNDSGLEQRASQLKMRRLQMVKLSKNNLANRLAGLALHMAKTNKERHEKIQEFMLINDSSTIAAEIPVYLTHDDIEYFKKRGFTLSLEDYRTPITGHIDVLQVRNNMVHVLDYKPEAKKERKAVEQLTIYALALASRTKLPLGCFKCAWFDEKDYYEFFPLHCVCPKRL